MKIALAGTGAMGVIHMKALKKIDGVEVVSIASRTDESGKSVRRGMEASRSTRRISKRASIDPASTP